jgi:predicted phosphodiesterase
MIEFKKYNGLLFVGDPHLSQQRTGKRNDIDLCTTILDKINQSVEIANKENLYLVFLGDLFDQSKEQNIQMLTRLTRILKKLKHPPVTAEGNHEKTQTKLSDDVALKLLQESDTLYVIEKNSLWGKFNFNGKIVYLGATPYGDKIPDEVILPAGEEPGSIIWVTHDNLDFGNSYPGVIPLKEVKGVDMLVNGHIHQTKKSQTKGKMRAHNPGNITRQSIDTKDHIPSVWKWVPEQEFEIEPIVLKYEKEVFNMVGYQIVVDEPPSQIADELTVQQTSQFVDKMEELQNNEPVQTQDGTHLRETIKIFAKGMKTDDDFTQEILEILDESLARTE